MTEQSPKSSSHLDRIWPWRPFVRLSLISALGPGLAYAFFLGLGPAVGLSVGRWYPALVQVHAYVMLMGWGVGMILGVALHFLPRLRGAKELVWRAAVPAGFWSYSIGILLRAAGQSGLSILLAPLKWLNWVVAIGAVMQMLGLALLLAILVKTFRTGPPLSKRKGFLQILPVLGVALFALILAHIVWAWAVLDPLFGGRSLELLSPRLHRLGAEFVLFGGVVAVSVAMSARLFPLSFRIRQSSQRGIRVTAGLILAGIVLALLRIEGVSAVCYTAGILTGTFSIRVLHPRAPFKADKVPYRFSSDPSGTGVLTAYLWAVFAAMLLAVYAWVGILGGDIGSVEQTRILALHAMGLGFMTLLIVSVGWAMLPGFAGESPRGRKWIWSAIIICNIGVALRVVPGSLSQFLAIPEIVQAHVLACAGLTAWLGLAAFAVALHKSFNGSQEDQSSCRA